ncbi:MAG TPA: methyltransferase domain-containing protein [Candidatus Paceibacterota bacterium]|nr:methyltransferase domain-containing protein [Candidatus Paceibacterota bacterium]
MEALIAELRRAGVLRSAAIARALGAVDRADFVPDELRAEAYEDTALPIGRGQTISQPYTVVVMLEALQARRGNRVFEIGYGSGWVTALLAHLVGHAGRVYAFEIVPELCAFGKRNLEKYPILAKRVELTCASAEDGYPAKAPFDRITAAATVDGVPNAWRDELAPGGRMVYPKGDSLFLETKSARGTVRTREFPGFVFVPLVTAARGRKLH